MNSEEARARRKRAARRRRGFTLLELAVAAAIFLTASAGLTLVVTQVLSTNALSAEQLTIRAALSQAASQIVSSPGAYDSLLNNTFSVPNPCPNQGSSGTTSQSCLVASGTTWAANWGIQLGGAISGVGASAAAYLTLTGRVVLANGTIIQVSRVVDSPSYAYSSGNGVLKVQVSDPGGLLNGPVYLLSMANPTDIVASGQVSAGEVTLSAPAANCTMSSPCVLGLSSGNDYGVSGKAAMLADQMTGPGADIVLTSGQVTSAALTIRGVGSETLSLAADNLSTGQVGQPSAAGSICLYANFNDGVSNVSAPVCNFTDASTITMYDYAPDPTRPGVRLPLPLNTPITLTTDPANGVCPYVTNPTVGSLTPGLVGWSGSGWVGAGGGVCTSWTWGNPTSFSSNGTTTPWSGASIILSGGTTGSATVTWSANGNPGGLYVIDQASGAIRLVSATGAVNTIGSIGVSVNSIVENASGSLFISAGNAIYSLSPTGSTSLLAGSASNAGNANGTAGGARFNSPHGLALSPDGSILYVADSGNNAIREVSTTSGAVSTLNVSGVTLSYPNGLAVNQAGDIIVANQNSCQIDEITPNGAGGVLAGSGVCGYLDGTAGSAKFNYPQGVAVDQSGNVYVADSSNNRIRVISPSGNVTTLAGSGAASEKDGIGTGAQLNYPTGITWMDNGILYITDANGQTIRSLIISSGAVSTLAGAAGAAGEVDAMGSAARFSAPVGVASGSGIWSSAQPAIGFGAIATWSMPRDMQRCSGGCLSLGQSVPENTACPDAACDSADVAYLTGPETGGVNSLLISGAVGSTVTINLLTQDYFGQAITAKLVNQVGSGSLTTMAGASLGVGSTIGSTGAGGGEISLKWTEGAQITQTWFTVGLSNGVTTTNYDVGLYRSAGAWILTGYGVSIPQGSSAKIGVGVTQIDGTLASGDSVSFTCASCPAGVSFSPTTANSEVNGVASSLVSVGASATAGTYPVTVSSGGRSSTARLTISPVAAALTMTMAYTATTQGGGTTATVGVTDSAGNPMSGVGVSVMVYSGAAVASGVYAPSGGCVTDSTGGCSVDILVQGSATAGNYVVEAVSGALSASSGISVSGTPSYIVSSNISLVAGGAGAKISAEVLDGSQSALPGVYVGFSGPSAITLSSNWVVTDSSGVASTVASAPAGTPAGTYTVYAQAGSISYAINVTVT